ncbi:hypothetical protein BKA67DRAFT_531275 [Truncatella angustata]|uniref:Synaptobrevin n=1 Tax=Truncatella angustata TaxID=152316 RepID=A0A9P8UZV4_9PEZI|nr:uncharacterized protein BKA67DRAFT_531275 [Truncatella angustata]KAH6661208.1 hypothetical protein BKA67DRAFT_531275 [Truncatella angustata]
MARLTQPPMTPRRSASNPDSFTDLNRLLARLQQSILQADAEREHRLRTSEYERNKASINLEYARTLLTKLEQDALNIKVHSRRQETQADLNRKREVFEQISERLHELEELSIDSDGDDSDDEDLLGAIQTPSESQDSRSSERPSQGWETVDAADYGEQEAEGDSYADESTIMPEPRQSTQQAPQPTSVPESQQGTSTEQALRSRGVPAQPQNDKGETTARAQLFGNQASSPTTALSTTATTEAILDHQRAEQDKLTESLLSMAQSLKSQSHAFQSDLESEKDILSAAGAGMDKSERGMEAATRRMGSLRKLTEGKGWWGRMMLYAWIFGLMVVAVLIVGVMPKLRF